MATAQSQPIPQSRYAGTITLGALLLAVVAVSWIATWRAASHMVMPGASESTFLAQSVAFVAQWGMMMTAMMLPSAAPMILFYQSTSRKLAKEGDRVIPAWLFAAVYLAVWTATGFPVYAAYLAVDAAAQRWPAVAATLPYLVATTVIIAGLFQFTSLKTACLSACESPLQFMMTRFRSGYRNSMKLALAHAGYCVGCCWGLMVVLVAAGAMSIPWVLTIAMVVFAEKLLPSRWKAARVVGILLIVLGVIIAVRPELSATLRGSRAMEGVRDMGGMKM